MAPATAKPAAKKTEAAPKPRAKAAAKPAAIGREGASGAGTAGAGGGGGGGGGSGGAAVERPHLRRVQGVVASDKGDKTIKVLIAYQMRHPKYGKYIKRRTVLHAHDQANEAKEGDTVELAECRPLSKTKHHRLVRIVQRAPERAVQLSAEEVMTGKAPEAR
jgi:small subunit ribosomal protein S17